MTWVPARLTVAKERLQGLDQGTLLAPGYRCRTAVVDDAGVQQRWLLLTSVHALRRAAQTVTRQIRQDSERETAAFNTRCQQRFAGAADAQQALEAYYQGLKVIQMEAAAVQPL